MKQSMFEILLAAWSLTGNPFDTLEGVVYIRVRLGGARVQPGRVHSTRWRKRA